MPNKFKSFFQKDKPVQYYIIYNNVERKVEIDPKGWEDEAIGISRGEYHGMDREIGFELEFFGSDAEYLKSIFDANGFGAQAKLKVVVQNNNLSLSDFIIVDLKFSEYSRNPKTYSVTIPVEKIGVAQLIETYKDTEYQFDLDLDDGVQLINYSGLTRETTNQIQLGVGELALGDVPPAPKIDLWAIRGFRVNREYSEHVEFTKDDGAPYEWCKFRIKKTGRLKVRLILDFDIAQEGLYGAIPVGRLILTRNRYWATAGDYEEAISNIDTVYPYYPLRIWPYRYVNGNFTRETYKCDVTIDREFIEGDVIELVYKQSSGDTYTDPYIPMNGIREAFIDIWEMAASPKQNYQIRGVTFEWAINKILRKIYTDYYGDDSILDFNYYVPRPVLDLITSSSAIRQLEEQRIKVSLDKLFKNLNIITPISIRCEDDKINIGLVFDAYRNDIEQEIIPCNNIEEKVSVDDIYNNVIVGTSFSVNSKDEKNGQMEPLCKNTYTIKTPNVVEKKEYDLVLDFICSPTQIEEYMVSSMHEEGTSKEGDTNIYMFACEENYTNVHSLYRNVTITRCDLDNATVFNLAYSPKRLVIAHKNILAHSAWRNNNQLIWQSADYNHDLLCKFDFETEFVEEGTNYSLSSELLYNPINITADVCKEITTMLDVSGDYPYTLIVLRNVDTGEIFKGFIDKASFSVMLKMKKQIELKGYDINQ